jgi:hypothetical protein
MVDLDKASRFEKWYSLEGWTCCAYIPAELQSAQDKLTPANHPCRIRGIVFEGISRSASSIECDRARLGR